MKSNRKSFPKSSSWETSHRWYDSIVGQEGHYYHKSLIFKDALPMLDLKPKDSLLDLGCGEGVLSRQIPTSIDYTGIDISPSLIKKAKEKSKRSFHIGDISHPLELGQTFSHAALILVIQNIENHENVFENAHNHLQSHGKLLIVMNHPCFRIPRQSSWEIDPAKKLQYRRIDRYMQPLTIPIQTHPSQKDDSPTTVSFHHPLSTYVQALSKHHFAITALKELISPKASTGGKAAMENRARGEFPLFLCLLAQKTN